MCKATRRECQTHLSQSSTYVCSYIENETLRLKYTWTVFKWEGMHRGIKSHLAKLKKKKRFVQFCLFSFPFFFVCLSIVHLYMRWVSFSDASATPASTREWNCSHRSHKVSRAKSKFVRFIEFNELPRATIAFSQPVEPIGRTPR